MIRGLIIGAIALICLGGGIYMGYTLSADSADDYYNHMVEIGKAYYDGNQEGKAEGFELGKCYARIEDAVYNYITGGVAINDLRDDLAIYYECRDMYLDSIAMIAITAFSASANDTACEYADSYIGAWYRADSIHVILCGGESTIQ